MKVMQTSMLKADEEIAFSYDLNNHKTKARIRALITYDIKMIPFQGQIEIMHECDADHIRERVAS